MNRTFITIMVSLMAIISCGQPNTSIQVTAIQFQELISKNKGSLLDVRTIKEFANGHITGAGQLNYYALDFKKNLLLLPKNQPVYLYCYSGSRSRKAANILVQNGYTKVYNLQKGLIDWNLQNMPLVIKSTSHNHVENTMEPDEFSNLIQSEKLVFIDFYAPWCAPCRKMMPSIDRLKTEFKGKVNIVKINIDASKKLAKEQQINAIPFLVLYKNGEKVYSHNGLKTHNELTKILKSNL